MNITIELSKVNNKPKRSLTKFFGLISLISFPIWILTALTMQFIPKGMPVNNIGFILVLAPITVAFIRTYKDNGKKEANQLLKRAFDYKRIIAKVWYLPTLFVLPGISFLSLGLMTILGIRFPEISISIIVLPILISLFFLFAISEEVGWQGYVFKVMNLRWSSLKSSIVLGIIWALWHAPLYLLQDRTGIFILVPGQCLFTVILRVLIVWVYNHANKSLFTSILIHAISNLCTMILPIYTAPLGLIIASILITISLIFGTFLKGFEGESDSNHRN